MTSAAIYVRISSDPTRSRLGVTRQLADCRKLATDRGLTVKDEHVFEDNDISATYRKRRPGLEALRSAIASREVDCIIVWHQDRLIRHPTELEDLISFVTRHDVTILQVTAGDLDLNTPTGQAVARIVGAMATQEVQHKAERHARKHLEIAQQGRSHGGRRPLGYEPDRVTIRESEASLLREAARRLLETDSSVNAVCEWLTAVWPWDTHETKKHGLDGASIPTARPPYRTDSRGRTVNNRLFKPRVLRDTLTTAHIAGKRIHLPQEARRSYLEQLEEAKEAWANGQPAEAPTEPLPMIYEAVWDPVLDEATWLSIRRYFDNVYASSARRDLASSRPRTALPRRGRPPKSPLGGILRCGRVFPDETVCSANLGASANAYKCPPTVSGGCSSVSISRSVEQVVWNLIGFDEEMPLSSLLQGMFSAYYNPSDTDEAALAEVARLNEKRNRLVELRVEGDLDREKFLELRSMVDIELVEAKVRIAKVDRHTEDARQVLAMTRLLDPLETKNAERFLLSKLIDYIVVAPSASGRRSGSGMDLGRLTIHWSKLTGKKVRVQRFAPGTPRPELQYTFNPLVELAIAARRVGLLSPDMKVDPTLRDLLEQAPSFWRAGS